VSRYLLSPRARGDLEAIWDYSQSNWGAEQAEAYLRQIQRALETLARDPRRGRPCDEIRPGYRKFPAASHVIFFRLSGDDLDVVRILHQRMDYDSNL
jgi:toxin ParE1/3/4